MTQTTIAPGENLLDVVVNTFGTLEAWFDVVQLNGVGATDELPAGAVVDVTIDARYPDRLVTIPEAIDKPYDAGTVQPGQNVMDMAVQLYGSLEGLFDLAQKNGLAPTGNILPGVIVAANAPTDRNLRNIIMGLGIVPATAVDAAQAEALTPDGIDYWAIAVDFIIS